MQIVALAVAIIGIAALITGFILSNEIVAWVAVGAGAVGLAGLIIDAFRERGQRAAHSAVAADEVVAFDADYPDERPAADAPAHAGDKEIQREIMREEWVLHPDTGPLNPDVAKEEAAQAIIRHHPHRSHR